MGGAYFALRQSPRPRFSHRSGTRQRALHADELSREPGQSLDEQQHRSRDSYAGIQRGFSENDSIAGDWRQPVASNKFALGSSDAAARSRGRAQMAAGGLSHSGTATRSDPAEAGELER